MNPKIHIKRGCGACKYWLKKEQSCALRTHVVVNGRFLCSDYSLDWNLYDLILNYLRNNVDSNYRGVKISKATWWYVCK
mgnify:CR=1 FL=1